jgi:hypothetical protein
MDIDKVVELVGIARSENEVSQRDGLFGSGISFAQRGRGLVGGGSVPANPLKLKLPSYVS